MAEYVELLTNYLKIQAVQAILCIIISILSRIKVYKRQSKFNNFNIQEINKNGLIIINDFLRKDPYNFLLEDLHNLPLALNKGETNTIRYNNKF